MLSVYPITGRSISDSAKWKKEIFKYGSEKSIKWLSPSPITKANDLCFSNDSKYILTWGYSGNIRILNAITGDILYEDSLQEKNWSGASVPAKIVCASFFPDDERIIYGVAERGFILDIKSGLKKEIRRDTNAFYF